MFTVRVFETKNYNTTHEDNYKDFITAVDAIDEIITNADITLHISLYTDNDLVLFRMNTIKDNLYIGSFLQISDDVEINNPVIEFSYNRINNRVLIISRYDYDLVANVYEKFKEKMNFIKLMELV